MIQILEYIMQHYTLFLGSAILILLAIIGYYADKTNFGQTKNNKLEEKNKIENNNETSLTIQEVIQNEENEGEIELEQSVQPILNEDINNQNDVVDSDIAINENSEEIENNIDLASASLGDDIKEQQTSEEVEKVERKINPLLSEAEIEKFNIEFDSILPEKDVIDGDLLSDIDDLNFDKTQKIDLSDVPDLDDIELPKIKQMDIEEDIWKF